MALNFISNYAANVAHRQLSATDAQATSSLAKLSSGTRVVSAKDDAAAMAIGSRMNSEIAALRQANVNAGQASSMLQIADGAMARVSDILTRMKTLAVQASSGQLGNTERGMLDTEYQSLLKEVDRIAGDTEFNGNRLVSGSTASALTAQGFAKIELDPSVGDAVVTFDYDNTTRTLTATNETTGLSQAVTLTGANKANETVNFADLGVKVELSKDFNRGTALTGAAPDSTATDDGGTPGAVDKDTIRLASVPSAAALDALKGIASGAITLSGTGASATLSLGATGYSASGVDLSVAGPQKVTLTHATTGDSFDIAFEVQTGFGAAATVSGDIQLGTATAFTVNDANLTFKIGTGTTANVDTIDINIDSITTHALGIDNTSIASAADADKALNAVGKASDKLNVARANIGASQNRLEFAAANLSTTIENQEAARSQLLDLDVAAEMTRFTSKQVLMQAGVAMLAQANQMPQNLMRLLG